MAEQISKQKGVYLYAVACELKSGCDGCIGIDGGAVYMICQGNLMAAVSDVSAPNRKIRPERRHLAAHAAVLKSLMQESTVLPISFGIIANSKDAVK